MQNNSAIGNGNGAASASHHACASCKHQRKRCGPECVLAPYFPAERTRQFQAVHRVFGVSNVSKMIRSVTSHEERSRAVQSMVWEAEWRLKDPVSGCFGEYLRLRRELDMVGLPALSTCSWCGNKTSTANHHHHLSYSNNNNNVVVNNTSGTSSTLVDDNIGFNSAFGNGSFGMDQNGYVVYSQPIEKDGGGGDRGRNLVAAVVDHRSTGFGQRYCMQDQFFTRR